MTWSLHPTHNRRTTLPVARRPELVRRPTAHENCAPRGGRDPPPARPRTPEPRRPTDHRDDPWQLRGSSHLVVNLPRPCPRIRVGRVPGRAAGAQPPEHTAT